MPDFLDILARDARATIDSGYYAKAEKASAASSSLKRAIAQCRKAPVIAEVKVASPSAGIIRQNVEPQKLSHAMARGGAVGISVLTEPKHFCGTLDNLRRVKKSVSLPVLMKDIIVSPMQLTAASSMGADAVLMIQAVFDRGYGETSLAEMIADAHFRNIEVLLETHNADEFRTAVDTEADLIGINNRDLASLKVDLNVTRNILKFNSAIGKPVVSESGICSPMDLRFLRECGSQAFLIGSAIMLSSDVEARVTEFVNA